MTTPTKKKSKFFEFAEKILTREYEVDAPAPKKGTAPAPTPPVASSPAVVTSTVDATRTTGIVDDNLKAKLWEAIHEKDAPGFDFLELTKIIDSDDKTLRDVDKYTSAFRTMKALDSRNPTPKSTLLTSGQSYLDVLAGEKEVFQKEFSNLADKLVGTKKGELDAVTKEAEALRQQKEEIEKQLKTKQEQVGALSDEISKHEIDLQRREKDFIATMDSVANDIKDKLTKVEQFIPADVAAEAQTSK